MGEPDLDRPLPMPAPPLGVPGDDMGEKTGGCALAWLVGVPGPVLVALAAALVPGTTPTTALSTAELVRQVDWFAPIVCGSRAVRCKIFDFLSVQNSERGCR